MIGRAELIGFPVRPESEFEWEDLLLRLELMPKALRVELESAPPAARDLLARLVTREAEVQHQLEAQVADGTTSAQLPASSTGEDGSAPHPHPNDLVDVFIRLRSRNFAMLQRRGLEVWNWRVDFGDGAPATVFQLLSWLAREDVDVLAKLRAARAAHLQTC